MSETAGEKANSRSSLQLEMATVADAPALADLVNSAYRGDSSRKGWTTEADLLGGQRTDAEALCDVIGPADSHRSADAQAATPEQVILFYREGQLPLACVYLKRQGQTTYLGMLTVSPSLQAGGIGRKMLEGAEAWAISRWQAKQIEMTVIQSRAELIAWYERRGYKKTARREPFPAGNPRFGLPKVAGLEFIVLVKNLSVTSPTP